MGCSATKQKQKIIIIEKGKPQQDQLKNFEEIAQEFPNLTEPDNHMSIRLNPIVQRRAQRFSNQTNNSFIGRNTTIG